MPEQRQLKRRMIFDAQELRAENKEGEGLPEILGYAALFNVSTDLGYGTESIAQGAFTESLQRGDDVRALFNHDPNLILGRTKARTLALVEDLKGLKVRISPPETTLGKDLVKSIERGDISQMSFGFYIDAEDVSYSDDSKPHFTIVRASLFDVSPVTFPAYEQTSISLTQLRMSRIEANRKNPKAELEARERARNFLNLCL